VPVEPYLKDLLPFFLHFVPHFLFNIVPQTLFFVPWSIYVAGMPVFLCVAYVIGTRSPIP
jgi:hypothetical protein